MQFEAKPCHYPIFAPSINENISMPTFSHHTIWITGASSGIGEALALAFAAEGTRLALSARREAELQRVAEACRAAGAEAVYVQPLDLADTQSLPRVAQQVLQQAGPVDILVNNGGISQRALALDTRVEVDERLMRVNYLGAVALTKAVLPHMLQRQKGRVVVITSLTGKFGSPLRSGYAASKHALHGFFDSLRAELAHTPIRILLVCPGFVRTQVSVNALTADGTPQGTMDEATQNGMAPEVLAQQILRAIRQDKEEVWLGGKEVLGVYVKRFFPRLFSRLIAKAKVT